MAPHVSMSSAPSNRPGCEVSGDTRRIGVAPGVVDLWSFAVLSTVKADSPRVRPRPAAARPCDDTVKDFDDLCSEGTRKLALPSHGVLASHPALLVGGGSERK